MLVLLLTAVAYLRTAAVPVILYAQAPNYQTSEDPDNPPSEEPTRNSCGTENQEEEFDKFLRSTPINAAIHLNSIQDSACCPSPAVSWASSHPLIYVLRDLRL